MPLLLVLTENCSHTKTKMESSQAGLPITDTSPPEQASQPQYKCHKCPDFGTSDKEIFERHLKAHKVIERPRPICDACGHGFSARSSLVEHKVSEHAFLPIISH